MTQTNLPFPSRNSRDLYCRLALPTQFTFNDIDTDGDLVDGALKVTYSTIYGWMLYEVHFFIDICIP